MITHSIVRGRGLRLAALAALLTLAAVVAVPSSPAQPTAEPAVVSTTHVAPKPKRVIRKSFRPWARPSPRAVRKIIRLEARRWRISPARLARRVACESGYRWSARGGPYFGLLQFAPSTFARGLRTIRTRRVKIVRETTRRVRGRSVTRYSDGRVVRKRGRLHRQRVVTVLRGTLPRRPGITHAWTQLRIGAQAIRGISGVRSSEWGCAA